MAVEISRGLIRQQNFRMINQRSSQRRPLLLSTRKFARTMVHPRPQPHAFQCIVRHLLPLAAINLREPQRQFDIFRERHAGNQIERLKDHANNVQPVLRQLLARKFRQIAILDDDASRSRSVSPAIRFNIDDLPDPELPSSATNSPLRISSETPSTARISVSPMW